MALKIRLARHGRRKNPFYWIVVADSRYPRDGKYLAKLGTYAPLLKHEDANRVKINHEAIQDWIKKGAQSTKIVSKLAGLSS